MCSKAAVSLDPTGVAAASPPPLVRVADTNRSGHFTVSHMVEGGFQWVLRLAVTMAQITCQQEGWGKLLKVFPYTTQYTLYWGESFWDQLHMDIVHKE